MHTSYSQMSLCSLISLAGNAKLIKQAFTNALIKNNTKCESRWHPFSKHHILKYASILDHQFFELSRGFPFSKWNLPISPHIDTQQVERTSRFCVPPERQTHLILWLAVNQGNCAKQCLEPETGPQNVSVVKRSTLLIFSSAAAAWVFTIITFADGNALSSYIYVWLMAVFVLHEWRPHGP